MIKTMQHSASKKLLSSEIIGAWGQIQAPLYDHKASYLFLSHINLFVSKNQIFLTSLALSLTHKAQSFLLLPWLFFLLMTHSPKNSFHGCEIVHHAVIDKCSMLIPHAALFIYSRLFNNYSFLLFQHHPIMLFQNFLILQLLYIRIVGIC